MLVLVALLQAAATPCAPATTPSAPPPLIVQVVDPAWLPIPGAEVIVTSRKSPRARGTATAGRDGFAQLTVPRDAEYDIEARLPGFKTGRVKGVQLSTSTLMPTAYVQVRLKVAITGEPVS